jgi:hypothetical protein
MEGEPEDAVIYRDFADITKIPGLIRDAFNRGRHTDEELVIEVHEYNPRDVPLEGQHGV